MKLFRLNFATIVLRYYLMMLIVIVAGFTGQWWLATLALPVFLSCLMALKLGPQRPSGASVQRPMQPSRHTAVQSAA
ncbi:MAG: hypothetical protein R3301_14030 [Saprospiraceae bacterium]|nr:hypothetical protein [Saprospiraceae bacterium]